MLGLSLTQRQPAPGELWADNIVVLEVRPAAPDSIAAASSFDSSSTSTRTGNSNAMVQPVPPLGTVYLDLNKGYAAQLLLYGQDYPVLCRADPADPAGQALLSSGTESAAAGFDTGAGHCSTPCPSTQPGHHQCGGSSSSSIPRLSCGTAVALGLQSGGALSGTHEQVALGLWELCHEMGHAINFILSSSSSQTKPRALAVDSSMPSDTATGRLAYHLHASWLPVELVEVPSTLFEALAMDSATLQLLCRHQQTGNHLPAPLADKLAQFMREAHYSPALYQGVVRYTRVLAGMSGLCRQRGPLNECGAASHVGEHM